MKDKYFYDRVFSATQRRQNPAIKLMAELMSVEQAEKLDLEPRQMEVLVNLFNEGY